MLSPRQNMFKSSGFSLIELMIAVTIIAFLLAVAMPNYRAWIQNTKVRTAAESIQTGIQKARAEAVTRNARVAFTLGANSGWIVGCPTVTGTCPAVIEQRQATEGSSNTVTITATPAGATTVVFSNLGTRVANAADFTDLTITINTLSASEKRDLKVLVGASGNVRMCDPLLSLATNPQGCV